MSALFVLIAVSILVAGSFLTAFLWSVRTGQFDDDETPSMRMLFDENTDPVKANNINQNKTTNAD